MTINIKNKHNGQTAPANINLQDLLVKASQDAEIAKSAVKEVFSQALRKRKGSINELETPANIDKAPEDNGFKSHEMPPGNGRSRKLMNELDAIKRGLARKITNNNNLPRNASVIPPTEIVQPTDRLIEAVSLAREKIRKSREEAETYKKNAQAAVVAHEDKEVKMKEKIKAIKQQLLISTREAQAKSQKAYDEAKAIGRETRAAVKRARMENRKMIEDAKMEVIKAQEVARRANKEAELAISRVNDTMMKVQQEIISITVNEMSETGQELVEVTKSIDRLDDNHSRASVQNLDQNQPVLNFDRVIQLWQNTKQTVLYIYHTIKTRFNPKGV
jgi:hypothetical protein